MQRTAPKQCKLLGATVRGLGVVVAVSSTLTFGYGIVEGAEQVNPPQRRTTRVVRVSN